MILELTRVVGDVRDGLRIWKAMPIGEVLHAEVPPQAVAESHQLARQNGEILTADARKLPVCRPAPVHVRDRQPHALKYCAPPAPDPPWPA